MFFVNEVGTDSKGRPYIKMVEVNENAEQRGEQVHTEERSVAVRDVQEAQGIHADVRGVSETDSAGNSDGKIDLQGERTGKVNTTEQLHEEVTEQIERTSFHGGARYCPSYGTPMCDRLRIESELQK